jgi:hypothetical protein
MPVLVAAGQGQHRATGLTEADGRFADGDSAGIWPITIQHSVTGTTLPWQGRCCTQGALLSSNDFRVKRRASGEPSSVMTSAQTDAGWFGRRKRWSSSCAVDRLAWSWCGGAAPVASCQLSWSYGWDRQDHWGLSRALIYQSSAATLADQVAASPTLLVMPLSGQWHRGVHARSKRPQAASRAAHVEVVGKGHLPAPALRLRAREHLGVPQALPRPSGSWRAGRGGYSEDQTFSLLSHGNLGSLCDTLWSERHHRP